MSHTDAFALGRSELNSFLWAEVGVDSNGMTLSVLSVLARLGQDPWDQAGHLAALPKAAAVGTLAKIIVEVSGGPWRLPEANAIAARLVDLLPTHKDLPAAPSAKISLANFQVSWPRAVLLALLSVAIGATVLSLGREQEPVLHGDAFSTWASEPRASP
ncbi:hypothetical protein [Roseomonas xinghualingensis]|uniref:hypothetical protein n=1 Tax=Roseomonas xinghualingensis TaxID=2986475 RepID=UPI0021F0B680|nr:hypothetical protein [Roseomonas sp. SXEYE001]MCV4210326.1 hypothetical protein [Roseomonas sp. SXEYE001]